MGQSAPGSGVVRTSRPGGAATGRRGEWPGHGRTKRLVCACLAHFVIVVQRAASTRLTRINCPCCAGQTPVGMNHHSWYSVRSTVRAATSGQGVVGLGGYCTTQRSQFEWPCLPTSSTSSCLPVVMGTATGRQTVVASGASRLRFSDSFSAGDFDPRQWSPANKPGNRHRGNELTRTSLARLHLLVLSLPGMKYAKPIFEAYCRIVHGDFRCPVPRKQAARRASSHLL